ncbi:MAG TPA: DUF3043 domain-containing protein [Jatrophihabitans sp.]|uniref:DUF3043 domain-containing protein n=1 Tax=Jatrophihabitans sp. TaxID=1932789 RepID=UPI002DFEC86D|nr:DUF3043 domain-containing protein [Jatrophihabitans sp.]
MKLSRRGASDEPETEVVEPTESSVNLGKGRPTPKRRDAEGRRGPVTAPKTRKEAYARQKQLGREQKATRVAAKPQSAAEQRAALKRGDPSALPRRDQGPTRKLARDYVDSKRMFSNYLLWLFPLFIASYAVPILSPVTILLFLGFVVEWFLVGRRIRAMAVERFGKAEGSPLGIGFYAGSRAYLPRRWRLPGPQVERGEDF